MLESFLSYCIILCLAALWSDHARKFILGGPWPHFWRSLRSIVQNADFPRGDKTSRWSCANWDSSANVLHSLMLISQVLCLFHKEIHLDCDGCWRINILTPKSVLAGTKPPRWEGFWLANHKDNIPTMMELFSFPAALFWWTSVPHPQKPTEKGLDEAAVEGF